MATRAKWIERVERWEQSGLNAAEFAQREGVNPTQFERWCREMRAPRASLAKPECQSGSFGLPVAEPAPPPAPAWIDIPLPAGGLVRLRPGVDPFTLTGVSVAAAELASRRRK